MQRFQRWFYPLQTLFGIFLMVSQVAGIADVTNEPELRLRVLMTVVGVGFTLVGAIGWIVIWRERRSRRDE